MPISLCDQKQDIHGEDMGLPGVSDLSLGRENKNAKGMETTHHDTDAQVRPTTLVELLRHRAQTQFSKIAYIFLKDGETEEGSLTYAQLDQQARAIAARLRKIAIPGERALLLYPQGLTISLPSSVACMRVWWQSRHILLDAIAPILALSLSLMMHKRH